MPAIFPVIKRTTVVENVIVISGDDVTDERLTYDLPETHPVPSPAVAAVVGVDETHLAAVEQGILAVLLAANEPSPAAVEDVTGTEAQIAVAATHPPPSSAVTVDASVLESSLTPVAVSSVAASVAESYPPPTEDVTGTQAIVVVNEPSPPPAEDITLFVVVLGESSPAGVDPDLFIEAQGHQWPDTTVSNSSWTNPANVIDKNTSSFAACSATSSGVVPGTTSNTTNGTLVIAGAIPALTDLDITEVRLQAQAITVVTAGTPLIDQAVNMTFGYNLDDSGTFTTFGTQTALDTLLDVDLDITSAVGGSWGAVDKFRARATGSVTSGTGLAANVTVACQWRYVRLAITASNTY